MGPNSVSTGFKRNLWVETLFVLLFLIFSFVLLKARIDSSGLPGGDEGSWLSVATELSRGNGFTTRWLEYHYLEPYAVPRPDDFRYPGLALVLAGAFKIFSPSLEVARWTVAVTFLFFLLGLYLVIRKHFGLFPALLTLLVCALSPLQLKWATVIYTEALFGCGLVLLILCDCLIHEKKIKWWLAVGFAIGILYLIRPNAVLFLPALFLLYFIRRPRPPLYFLIAGVSAFFALAGVWMTRMWIQFGSPLHIAGSAGMLRATREEAVTHSVSEFLEAHGWFFPFQRVAMGSFDFFKMLHEFENSLEVFPLFGVLLGIISRKKIIHAFITIGFSFSLVASFYAQYGSWSGIRYFTPFLPFLYGFGIGTLWNLFEIKIEGKKRLRLIGFGILSLLLIAPAYYPQKYYLRKWENRIDHAQKKLEDFQRFLGSNLSTTEPYLAHALGQLNYFGHHSCVALQNPEMKVSMHRAMDSLSVRFIALTREENNLPLFDSLKNWVAERESDLYQTAESSDFSLWEIRKVTK